MSIHHENLYKEKEKQEITMPAEQQQQSLTKPQPLQKQQQNPVGQLQLLEAMRTALTKYPPDTRVRVVLTNDRYERLCTYLMPGRRTENKLLIADVARFDNV